jgi:hypothetical protein
MEAHPNFETRVSARNGDSVHCGNLCLTPLLTPSSLKVKVKFAYIGPEEE